MKVVIPGNPVAKGRPRFARIGQYVRTYTPKTTVGWEARAAAEMRAHHNGPPIDGPVRVLVVAVKKRPAKLNRHKDPDGRMWRTTKPDGDNCLKAACDAMVKARVVVDDTRLVDKRVLSLYTSKDELPCVEIEWTEVG